MVIEITPLLISFELILFFTILHFYCDLYRFGCELTKLIC
ncbi:putative membrane protein [Vibrio paracholerae HE-16]|nr:putative membrane protein [Vibrio paracholerae HE-16]